MSRTRYLPTKGGGGSCSQCGIGSCNAAPTGTIWEWLVGINAESFAGHADWRIPTAVELLSYHDLSGGLGAHVPSAFYAPCTPGCSSAG